MKRQVNVARVGYVEALAKRAGRLVLCSLKRIGNGKIECVWVGAQRLFVCIESQRHTFRAGPFPYEFLFTSKTMPAHVADAGRAASLVVSQRADNWKEDWGVTSPKSRVALPKVFIVISLQTMKLRPQRGDLSLKSTA